MFLGPGMVVGAPFAFLTVLVGGVAVVVGVVVVGSFFESGGGVGVVVAVVVVGEAPP